MLSTSCYHLFVNYWLFLPSVGGFDLSFWHESTLVSNRKVDNQTSTDLYTYGSPCADVRLARTPAVLHLGLQLPLLKPPGLISTLKDNSMANSIPVTETSTNLLSPWEFKTVDWIAAVACPIFLLAHVMFLFNADPRIVQRMGWLMLSLPWIQPLLIYSFLAFVMKSNYSRISLVIWIGFAAMGITLNAYYWHAILSPAA